MTVAPAPPRSPHSWRVRLEVLLLAVLVVVPFVATAPRPAGAAATPESSTAPVYRTPPEALAELALAPPTPLVYASPGDEWLLVADRPSLPPVAELARRELRLAGLRIDPRTSGPSRARYLSGLRLVRVADGGERPVTGLPEEPRLGDVSWSPDGSRVAFTSTGEDSIELWVLEAASGEARRVTDAALNLTTRMAPTWFPDGQELLVALVPADRGPEPTAPEVPSGPVIEENDGKTAPARTYQDLLADAHDSDLFAHYATARLARVALDGTVTRLGEPGIVRQADPSPDGRYVLVSMIHRPFSYLVPVFRFPHRVEVWDRSGALVHRLADLPLAEEVPIAFGSVPTGPREAAWREDADATLTWTEALDGGDAGAEADERDRLFLLPAPFDGDPVALATLGQRFDHVDWSSDDLALVSTWWWPTRNSRTWWVHPGSPQTAPTKIFDYSWEDRYHDPGAPVTTRDARGREVLRTAGDGTSFFLIGDGASAEGDRPFLDTYDLATGRSERLFRSEAPYYERPWNLLDDTGRTLLVRRESVEEPPNFFVYEVGPDGERAAAGEPRQVTRFPHPTPQLRGVSKELIRYRRDDGLELTATLYLPPGKTAADGPFPMLMWAYPLEYKSADAAGQVTDSPYRFVRIGWYSPLLFLARGYAVLDDPSMPIVGEGDSEPNDTYVEQLVASAKAAVDEVVRRGVAEPGHIAIGGHSYGAFMVANLLAHSDLFAAGIARSGAYNRTLTPFGFQSEERSLWQAPEVYFTMSPFMHADEVNEPLLLIHGQADNNSGTFPIQSERFYNALKGQGATARLVMLPFESHGYQGRESVLHMLWEMDRWLGEYVERSGGDGRVAAQASAEE